MELGLYGKKETDAYEKCQKLNITEKLSKINYIKITYFVLMFFSSRIELPGGIMPFGLAFFALEYLEHAPVLPAVIALSAAVLSPETMPAVFKICVSIVLFSVAARRWDIGKAPLYKGLVMSICAFLAGFFQTIGAGISLYDTALLIFESAVIILSVFLFSGAKSVFFGGGETNTYGAEDMICVSAFLSLSLIGLGLPRIWGFDPTCFFCALLLLALAYKNPPAAGTLAGVTIGLIYGFYEDNTPFILGAFALASLFCGFFGKFGRAAAALSFITAYSVAAYNSLPLVPFLLILEAVSTAALVFILLPKKALAPFFIVSEKKRSYADKLQELTYMDISDGATAIRDVAGIFESLCENRILGTEAAVSSFFERTARRLCDDCPRKNMCWRHEFHRTYTSFFVLLQLCEKNGHIDRADIPEELLTKCQRRESLLGAVNNMFEVYKVDKLWESRVSDSRQMLSRQLMCVSKRLLKTAVRVKSPGGFDSFKESGLSVYLSEQGIKTERVLVLNNRVCISLDGDMDTNAVDGAVSGYLGREYKTARKNGNTLCLYPVPKLNVKVGKAAKNKNDNPLSGDSSNCMFVDGGKYFLALSDGMGSGERAGRDSRAAVTIASKMLSAGFDMESAVSMINSVLVLKSAETSFATLDMAMLDLKRGTASFYKSGAAASFIKRGENVIPVLSASLPSGALAGADIERSSHKIKEGDAIFMVSDGVTGNGNTARISEIISKMEISDPGEMARLLLREAASLSANIISDDMTVLVATLGEAV